MEYLIGLDIGTSSVKGVILSKEGKVVCCKTKAHNYYYENDFKLMNADDFCTTCFDVIAELNKAISPNDEVSAICASGASGNLLFVKDGKPSSPVYGWQTNFETKIVDEVLSGIDADEVYKISGWPKIYSFPLAGLAYIKQTNPILINESDMICMHIEYLNYVMTGNWGITPSMATPFYLVNQEKQAYENKYLNKLGITENKLPPIMEHCSVLGTINDFTAEKTGLKKGTRVVLGTFDHPSAARGAGVFNEREMLVSCGTSWVVFTPFKNRETVQSKGMLTDPFMYPAGNWCGMKSLASISVIIDGYVKKYLGNISYKELDELAEQSVNGAHGLRIGDDTDTTGYTKSDIARAILESGAYKLNDMMKILEIDVSSIRLVGGVTKSKIWCKIISEITGKQVEVVNGEHAGAAGAAFMAGVGCGFYNNETEAFNKNYLFKD